MVLGPEGGSGNAVTLDTNGNGVFCGVMHSDGRAYRPHGVPDIHGMLARKSSSDMIRASWGGVYYPSTGD
jgi:hypothetical protein